MEPTSNPNELRLTRVYEAPLRAVWDAWTIPAQVEQWWGPRGFTLTTHSRELRVGGTWRYTMHGPDGVDYPNVTRYLVVEPLAKLVYDHGGTDETPPLFRVTATFSEEGGRTTLELVFALASPEAAAATAKFVRKVGGNATWDRLAEHLEHEASGRAIFVLNRSLAAPIDRVFDMWTRPEHLAEWLPPPGTTLRFLRPDIGPGKIALFVIEGPQGSMHVRAEYVEFEPPRRLAYLQSFVDADERPSTAPGAEVWPPTLRTTVVFVEEASDRTRITLTVEPQGDVTSAELEAFVLERAGMTRGWTASLDVLERALGVEVA